MTYLPETVPMPAKETGMFAEAAISSTAGAVLESVGDRTMPATCLATASCTFCSWFCALDLESEIARL